MVLNNINAVVQNSQDHVNILVLCRPYESMDIRKYTFSTRCSCRVSPSHNIWMLHSPRMAGSGSQCPDGTGTFLRFQAWVCICTFLSKIQLFIRLKPWSVHPLSSPRRWPPVLGTGQVPCRAQPEPHTELAPGGRLNGTWLFSGAGG